MNIIRAEMSPAEIQRVLDLRKGSRTSRIPARKTRREAQRGQARRAEIRRGLE